MDRNEAIDQIGRKAFKETDRQTNIQKINKQTENQKNGYSKSNKHNDRQKERTNEGKNE